MQGAQCLASMRAARDVSSEKSQLMPLQGGHGSVACLEASILKLNDIGIEGYTYWRNLQMWHGHPERHVHEGV